MDNQSIQELVKQRNARFLTIAFVDLQGQLRGKTVNAAKLSSYLDTGLPFSPYNHMLDFGDKSLLPRGYLSADLALEDENCRLVPEPRTLPFEDKDSDLMFFAEFEGPGRGVDWDPRVIYRRAEASLEALGYRAVQALEYEFRIFDETPKSARNKHYHDLELSNAVSTYGGVMAQGIWSELFKELRDMADRLAVPVASMHWEVEAGMAEVAISHDVGIRAADHAVLFKTHAKVSAQRHDTLLTFMARPFDDADGQSGHVHVSLTDNDGNPVFHDANDPHGMSEVMCSFVAGVQHKLPELLLMLAPNVNSYKRFVPGIFTPIASDWGVQNRTCALRVIPGKPSAQRVECRVPGSDANPYLVLAALLAAGAWGIRTNASPTPPQERSSYLHRSDVADALRFPSTFDAAIDRFHGSSFARECFSDDFVEMFAGTRRAQAQEFARYVTEQERARFLELA